jgi:hypothetical protein
VDTDLCEIVSQRKGHNIKTVVKFGDDGLQILKQKLIDFSIKKIEDGISTHELETDTLKKREKIIEDLEYEIKDLFIMLEEEDD